MRGSGQTFVQQGRVAVSVRLPREVHFKVREIAQARGVHANDLYQDVVGAFLDERHPEEPYLIGVPANATPVTLWMEPLFLARFRHEVRERNLVPANVVLTALIKAIGMEELIGRRQSSTPANQVAV